MNPSALYQGFIRVLVLAVYAIATQTSFWMWIVLLALGGALSNLLHLWMKYPAVPERPALAAISTAAVVVLHLLLRFVTGT